MPSSPTSQEQARVIVGDAILPAPHAVVDRVALALDRAHNEAIEAAAKRMEARAAEMRAAGSATADIVAVIFVAEADGIRTLKRKE